MSPGNTSRSGSFDSHTFSNVRTLLESVLARACTTTEVNELVRVCHALAIPHVVKRLSKERILKDTLRLAPKDLALDCVADLFAFSVDREFPHFHAYFAAYPLETLSDSEIVAHLRRLIFSHTNQTFFRLYNQVDPGLAKVIRNMKLAVQEFQSLVVVERFGEQCLAPSDCDHLIQLPALTSNELEYGLSKYIRGVENIPVMLGKLALFLTEQDEHSRIVPLTSAAIAFRSLYSKLSENNESCTQEDIGIRPSDVEPLVRRAVSQTKEWASTVYAVKKNISCELLELYFGVIEERFLLIYSGDGAESGLRELLALRMPKITPEEYRKLHRSRLEYLSRLTGNRVAKMLKSHNEK